MIDPDKYVEIKDRLSVLIEDFFKDETSADERKHIIEEAEKFPEYLAGALFTIIGWPYRFEIDGKPYTLEYNTKYYLETYTSEYELNLYSGSGEDKELIKREIDKNKAKTFTKFLKLVDAAKEGKFEISSF